ncbi:MAG: 2'-5' RNA ligase family protein, partial [Halobacteriales archaeon]
MYSLNVPVPGRVARLAADLAPELSAFDRVRDRHTLVLKRLGDPDPDEHARIQQRARRALAGTGLFEARIARVGRFERPPAGPAPVVYLAVEEAGLRAAHQRLVEEFTAVEGMEGDAYVPHVTLARGGATEAAARLSGREVGPVTWTVEELVFRADASG